MFSSCFHGNSCTPSTQLHRCYLQLVNDRNSMPGIQLQLKWRHFCLIRTGALEGQLSLLKINVPCYMIKLKKWILSAWISISNNEVHQINPAGKTCLCDWVVKPLSSQIQSPVPCIKSESANVKMLQDYIPCTKESFMLYSLISGD